MKVTYSHLLSPIQIGSHTIRNRIIASNAPPHFICGAENAPEDAFLTYYGNLAKNGAGIVVVTDWSTNQKSSPALDVQRYPYYDISDPAVTNNLSLLAESVHYYRSKILISKLGSFPDGYDVCDCDAPAKPRPGTSGGPLRAATEEIMDASIHKLLDVFAVYQTCGFDGVSLHMSYQSFFGGSFLSPLTNHRTDEYGGCLKNRARFPLRLCRAIKERFGTDFLVEVLISGEERAGGISVDDTIEFAKLAEGLIDILQIRAMDIELSHPTGYNSVDRAPVTLHVAEAVKKSGTGIVIAPVGGYQDLSFNDQIIAEGKCDMIAMARSFIADPDYGEKAYQGRGDDVVPCVRCNKCHVAHMKGPWINVCSVNPTYGIAHRLERLNKPSQGGKRIAVIGGGPAGMRAALYAAEVGHQVTLYEKSDKLGGQLFHADYAAFKWPLKKYKDWLVAQLKKQPVELRLGTLPAPEEIEAQGYDVVIAATGATHRLPPIAGINSSIRTPIEVFGHAQELGESVIVIGGAETGTETALYLAEEGHKVTILCRKDRLAYDATLIHFYFSMMERFQQNPNLTIVLQAETTRIDGNTVYYTDKNGAHKIHADTIVASGGVEPNMDAALAYWGTAPVFHMIGDCAEKHGNLQKCNRMAYAATHTL